MSRKDTIAFSFESWLEKGTWQNIFRLVARTGPGAAAASPVPNGTAGAGRLPVLKGLPSFNGLAKAGSLFFL